MSEEKRKDVESPGTLEEERTPTAEEQEEQAELSRRAFLRRTAEVAALSLFGPMALDAVIRRVARRVTEIDALDGMAREAAEYLAESGLGGIAYAKQVLHDCDRVGCSHNPPFGGCTNLPTQSFNCTPNTNPAFNCQASDGQQQFFCTSFKFQCGNFQCATEGDSPQFVCKDGYLCPAPTNGTSQFADNVGCPGTVGTVFNCKSEAQFTGCPGTADPPTGKVLCGQDQGAAEFTCTGTPPPEYGQCVTVAHTCPAQPPNEHTCGDSQGPASWVFSCTSEGDKHNCTDQGFDCSSTTQIDFFCNSFACNNPNDSFTCDATHLFSCNDGDFICEGGKGFTCRAGGELCNQSGVGSYGWDEPGDFLCYGQNQGDSFDCDYRFNCESADDFRCMGNSDITAFTCVQGGFACTPRPLGGAQFQCTGQDANDKPFDCGGKFLCLGSTTVFECGTDDAGISFSCATPAQNPPFECSATGNPLQFLCGQNKFNL